jgi:hypothetical protein
MAHLVRYATATMNRPFQTRRRDADRRQISCSLGRKKISLSLILLAAFCSNAVLMPGCGSSSGGSVAPPAEVVVSTQPASANLFLGQTQQFQAIVTGSSNTSVTWSVGGAAGGSASLGTISETGLYTAPSALPASATVTVTASSNANPEATASSVVTLKDDIAVNISPLSASVATGAGQAFTASVTGSGSPSTAVTWSVNGVASGNATLGTVVSNGNDSALYVAPAVPPSPAVVHVTAVSVADAAKSASANVTITCSATNSVSPSTANVDLAQTQTFTASFCVAAGATIAWDVNGIAGGNSTIGTIAPSGASAAIYSAPSALPSPNTVTVHAVGGGITATASVTLISQISVTVSPASSTLPVNHRMAVAASLSNTSNLSVSWFVNGVANGSAAVGQVCQSGSSPCVAPQNPSSNSVDYLAPASPPATDPVTLMAVSQADPSKSGSALVTVTGLVSVAVAPLYAFVAHSTASASTTQFFATITGGGSPGVTWNVQSGVAGQGCGGAACGSVDKNGVFTAPSVAPNPNAISIVATSVSDPSKSSSAAIAITSGPAIEVVLPSSAMAGAVESFPLTVQGANFTPGAGGSGSEILINGVVRTTTCQSAKSCTTVLNSADLQSAATMTLQVTTRSSPPLLSNPVPFVIVPFDISEDAINLTASQPAATGKDVTVVEPTTAASAAAIDVDFDGFLIDGGCEVEGTPLTVTRPVSGSAVTSICIHGNGLDPTFTYEFSGPGSAPGDLPVTASIITGLFSNTIELDLQISSGALPGVRTLFITTLNGDRAAATGILEVK